MKRKNLMLLLMAAVLTVFFATLTSASTIVKSWNISATSKDNVIARLYADEVNEEMYTLTISGTGNMKDWAFDSPNCAPWYYSYKSQITAVTIESGITNIGEYAFYWCSSLTDIVIPNSIVSIENSALSNCKKLINIEVDENNQYFCDVDGVLYTKNKSTLIKYPAGKQEDSFSVLNSVITIGNSAFYDCKNLENITIPNSVTTIGDSAFYNCGLKSLIIPNKITRIEENTFRYCSQLTKITIPKNIEFIGYYAFDGCRNLTIYCEAESQSNEWNGGWNPNNRPVVWNYKVTMLNNSFAFLGYSAREDGTGAICASYEIDYETIELYEYLTGEKIEFGAIFASYENLNGKQPLNSDGTTVALEKGKVLKQKLNDFTYTTYDFVLRDISDSIKDHSFVISLYAFNFTELKYNQGIFNDTVSGISYNQINQGE